NIINLSARLAEVCPAGMVVIDEATAQRAATSVELEQLNPILLKGRKEMIPQYRAVGERALTMPSSSKLWPGITEYWSPEQALAWIRQCLGTDALPLNVAQRLGLRDRQGRSSPVNPLFLEETLAVMLAQGIVRVEMDKEGGG